MIQCKRYSSAVGRRAISDAVGVMRLHRCTRSMAVTSNYFTEGAIELARANDTTLVDRDVLCQWIAQVNGRQDFSAPARTGPSMAGKILRGAAWVLLPQIMLPRAVAGAISGAIRKGAANSRAQAEAEAEAQRRRDVAARHVQMEAEEAARLRQVAAERQRQAEEAAADRIFVVKNGRTGGPFTREQARMFPGGGHLALTDKAWRDGPGWTTLIELLPEEKAQQQQAAREAAERAARAASEVARQKREAEAFEARSAFEFERKKREEAVRVATIASAARRRAALNRIADRIADTKAVKTLIKHADGIADVAVALVLTWGVLVTLFFFVK